MGVQTSGEGVVDECSADVCLELDDNILTYVSTADIGGVQFSHDGCVVGASASESGLSVAVASDKVLLYFLDGGVISAGSGTLLVFDGDVDIACLSDFIISDESGLIYLSSNVSASVEGDTYSYIADQSSCKVCSACPVG